MSVAYQDCSIRHGDSCAVAEGSMGPNFPNYGVHSAQDSLVRGFPGGADGSKGPNYPNHRVLTPQDSVIQGLSALSLYVQPQSEADVSPPEENRCMPLVKLQCASPELNRCVSPRGNENTSLVLTSPTAGSPMRGKAFGSHSSACDVAFVAHNAVRISYSHKSATSDMASDLAFIPHSTALNTAFMQHSTTVSRNNCTPMNSRSPDEHYGYGRLHGFLNTFGSPNSTLDVVAEDKPWEDYPVPMPDDLEPDTISSASSSSSFSSLNEMPLDSSSSGGDSHISGDTEAQSAYKGPPSDLSSSLGRFPPLRKGLSQFYAGKSRSFSCLGEVVSLKDLAKPENPHARKRKYNLGCNGPRLPPLQKGAASISKKSLHNGKSTLALAVAMSTKEGLLYVEEQEPQTSLGARRLQRSPVASRSYSLSDLQGAAGGHIFSSPNHRHQVLL